MPAEFNPGFQSPHWAWWIVLYFFVGGAAGGIYFTAAWLDLFGDANDRPAIRLGHMLAFPLGIVSGLFLIVDLGQPQRFWHMLFESERFPTPILKLYSPMSFGSVILFLFGAITFLSFVDVVFFRSRLLHTQGNPMGKVLSVIGALAGLALAGYTGAVLNVSNEPVWGTSPWLSALFLFSGVSTGIAALLLLARRVPRTTELKLTEADNYLMAFELVVLVIFLFTLGAVGERFIVGSRIVAGLFAIVIVGGILLPLVLHLRPRLIGGASSRLAALLVLLGGFVLRWAMLAAPQGPTL
jgi:protein NrfD